MGSKINKEIFDYSIKILFILFIMSAFIYLIGYSLYENLKIFIGNLAIISVILISILTYLFYDFINNQNKSKHGISDLVIFIIPMLYVALFYANSEKIIFYNSYDFAPIIMGFLIVIHFFLIFFGKLDNYINLNSKILTKILFILFIFLIGLILITNFTQEEKHTFKLFLNNCSSLEHFENSQIECKNILDKVIIGSKVDCTINNIELDVINGSFNFLLLNGDIKKKEFNKTPSFIVPENVGRISVNLYGKYENNTICLSTANSQTFSTYEQYKENKKNFATYLLALIGLILLSFPTIIEKWKKVLI